MTLVLIRFSRLVPRTQEDPYKLVILGKDPQHCCITRADLFFADGHMSIVTCDEEGIVRFYAYDPRGTSSVLCVFRPAPNSPLLHPY